MVHRTSKRSWVSRLSGPVLLIGAVGAFACNPPLRGGRLHVVLDEAEPASSCERAAPLSGSFAVQGIGNPHALSIPSHELANGSVTRGVTPGIYSITWIPDGRGPGRASAEPWTLPARVVAGVFSGQTTTVHVRRSVEPSLLLTQAR